MKTSVRPAAARTCAALAVAAALVAGPAGARAGAEPEGVYRAPDNVQLYQHVHYPNGAVSTRPINEAEWAALGWAPPRPAPVRYVQQASWRPDIYEIVEVDYLTTVRRLDMVSWGRLGWPSPQPGHVPGVQYVKAAWSDAVYAVSVLHMQTGRLDYRDWMGSGAPAPLSESPARIVKLTWDDTIGITTSLTEQQAPVRLTFAEWQAAGFPRPLTGRTLPGDVVCSVGEDLYYHGTTFEGHLTYAQWEDAGFPQPDGEC